MRRLFIFLIFFALCIRSVAQNYQPEWASLDTRPTPEWWLDAKFGIFIHWGVYSVPAFTAKGNYAEWYQQSLESNAHNGLVRDYHLKNYGNRSYYDLANDFHAELFEPDAWAGLFEKAGAKYVVLTAKHHDGFCLWPSTTADQTWRFPWNAMSTGPRRDLVGDLFAALRKTTVKPGLFYSLYEWYNPLWKFDHNRFAYEHTLPQLHDLVTTYQPWVLWADGDWEETPETWRSQQFLAWLFNQSPVREQVVVNDRWGSGVRFNHGGIYTPEYEPNVDFENHAWEESRGMGASYGYNRAEDAQDYSSTQALVVHLIDKVARGGNLLLDIGPDGHGKIPPIMQERLLEMGKWLEINGEAIYSTRRWRIPYQWSDGKQDYKIDRTTARESGIDLLVKQTLEPDPGYAVKEFFYTYNPKMNTLYAIFPKYPADNRIVLKDIQLPRNADVSFLTTKQRLRTDVVGRNTIVYLPGFDVNTFKSPHAFALKIANYGAFVARPEIQVNYEPQTMRPIVSMTCATPGATIRYTVDGSEPTDKSLAYNQPTMFNETRTIRARAFKDGVLASKVDTAAVRQYPLMPNLSMFRQPQAGLNMSVVQTDKYDMRTLQYASVQKNAVVSNFDLDPLCKTDRCGMIWKGYIYIPQTYGHQFFLESDDGSQLLLDGQLVVDNGGDHGMVEASGYANLQQGWHQLQLLYFNSGGASGLKVSFAPVGGARQPVPAQALAH